MRSGWGRYAILFSVLITFLSCKKNLSLKESPIETNPPELTAVTVNVNENVGGFYKALPLQYEKNTDSYPLLVFIHGGGGFGDGDADLPLLLNEGIPHLLEKKMFPPEFYVNDHHYSFIHLAPQFKKY